MLFPDHWHSHGGGDDPLFGFGLVVRFEQNQWVVGGGGGVRGRGSITGRSRKTHQKIEFKAFEVAFLLIKTLAEKCHSAPPLFWNFGFVTVLIHGH